MKYINGGVTAAKGFVASGIHCGIRKNQSKKDLAFIKSENKCAAAAVYTQNKVYGAPIVVTRIDGDRYRIIAGERRWRASKIAGLEVVPVIVKDYTDAQISEISLVENLQREDLNPLEEALGYKRLMETYSLTQEQVANKVSKSRSAAAVIKTLWAFLPAAITLLFPIELP